MPSPAWMIIVVCAANIGDIHKKPVAACFSRQNEVAGEHFLH
jgi:hypothetical protein